MVSQGAAGKDSKYVAIIDNGGWSALNVCRPRIFRLCNFERDDVCLQEPKVITNFDESMV